MVFVSGQIGLDPLTQQLVVGGIKEQTFQILENFGKILKDLNLKKENVVKTTVYMTDINYYPDINEVYGNYFQPPYPARSAVAVSGLPKKALVEIEFILQTPRG